MKKSTIVYWTHFVLVTLAHVAAIALPVSLVWFILALDSAWQLKVILFCVAFFVSILGINHVTSKDSVCVLTTLENYYQKLEGDEIKGEYIPRYYKRVRSIFTRGNK